VRLNTGQFTKEVWPVKNLYTFSFLINECFQAQCNNLINQNRKQPILTQIDFKVKSDAKLDNFTLEISTK